MSHPACRATNIQRQTCRWYDMKNSARSQTTFRNLKLLSQTLCCHFDLVVHTRASHYLELETGDNFHVKNDGSCGKGQTLPKSPLRTLISTHEDLGDEVTALYVVIESRSTAPRSWYNLLEKLRSTRRLYRRSTRQNYFEEYRGTRSVQYPSCI